MTRNLILKPAIALLLLLFAISAPAAPQDSNTIPQVDGAIGPCTAEFTVTDSAAKPVYNAKVQVHISYGFMSLHKLDLEVSTNVNGKARFQGLPNRLKRGLMFYASEGNREASTFDDPASTCQAQLTMVLAKKAQ